MAIGEPISREAMWGGEARQGIAPDFARIAHAFAARFLYPLVHLIRILKESVAAKDLPPRKRNWGRFHAMLEYYCVGKVDHVVPVPGEESM